VLEIGLGRRLNLRIRIIRVLATECSRRLTRHFVHLLVSLTGQLGLKYHNFPPFRACQPQLLFCDGWFVDPSQKISGPLMRKFIISHT
jgi:hypothetical protein